MNNQRTILTYIAAALIALLVGGCDKKEQLTITGASTLLPILQPAGIALEQKHHNLRVQVQAGGSTKGIQDTIKGLNQLGAVSRELKGDEINQVNSYPIAIDGVGIIVHSNNPITSITTSELTAIYRSSKTTWDDKNNKITVVSKADGHATLDVFLNYTGLSRRSLNPDVVAGNNAQVLRTVANIDNSIGYVSIGEAITAIEAGTPIKLIKLDGITPSMDAIAQDQWPMTRFLYLISADKPSSWSQIMLEFLSSADGKNIITEARYVPIH